MKNRLGKLESQMLAYVQLRNLNKVSVGDITGPLELSQVQASELLSRMARGGLIARVRPGLYLVPRRIPLGGSWSPNEVLALNTLMEDKEGRYQICGPNAFNRYGFDTQIPNRVYAYNDKLSGLRIIGSVELALIKVNTQRLGETEITIGGDGEEAVYSSRLRTLLDAVYDWKRFNSIPRAYNWIESELLQEKSVLEPLIQVVIRYGNIGTIRRIGALLERVGVKEVTLLKLEKALTPTSALIPWIPSRPKRGKVSSRWGVVYND
ncbi:hypothetical protein ACFL39_00485 [Gemmatimonadota bacterium]